MAETLQSKIPVHPLGFTNYGLSIADLDPPRLTRSLSSIPCCGRAAEHDGCCAKRPKTPNFSRAVKFVVSWICSPDTVNEVLVDEPNS